MYLILKFIFNVINLDSEKGLFHGGATVREEDVYMYHLGFQRNFLFHVFEGYKPINKVIMGILYKYLTLTVWLRLSKAN